MKVNGDSVGGVEQDYHKRGLIMGKIWICMCGKQDCTDLHWVTYIDGGCVVDPDGGVWWPDDAAMEEILASSDPAETAVRMCREHPMRGCWCT